MHSDLLKGTLQKLDELGSPEFGAITGSFFKGPIRTRGVRSPQLKELSAELYREIKAWPVTDRDKFVTGLWKDSHIETGALACYVYRRFAKSFGEREFRLFEQWLDRYAKNWAHCDGLSVYLLATAIARVPELADALPAWTESKNVWKRRAAAVALIKEAGHGRRLDLICEITRAVANDPEDLVQKGAGWLLKVAYQPRPLEIVEFLETYGKGWPRLVLRYAAEKMSAQDKRAVLSMGQ